MENAHGTVKSATVNVFGSYKVALYSSGDMSSDSSNVYPSYPHVYEIVLLFVDMESIVNFVYLLHVLGSKLPFFSTLLYTVSPILNFGFAMIIISFL